MGREARHAMSDSAEILEAVDTTNVEAEKMPLAKSLALWAKYNEAMRLGKWYTASECIKTIEKLNVKMSDNRG